MTHTNTSTKRAVFMMGGSGAGKSYIRKRMYGEMPVLDCDSIKESHPDYDPKAPQLLHAWSAQELKKKFYRTIADGTNFVYDGTGSNAEKYVSMIQAAQEMGYSCEVCYVRVRLATALHRNANRTRVVPEDVLREKHSTISTAFEIISSYADEVKVVNND